MTKKSRPALALSRPPSRLEQQSPDDAKAQAFIQGAEQDADAVPEPLRQRYPWEDPKLRQDVTRTFNLRLSEPLKVKLKWLSQQGPKSMHQIALEAVEETVERQIAELLR